MTYQARVGEDGRVALPEELSRELGLQPGDLLTIERAGGKLVVTHAIDPEAALERIRAATRGYSVNQFLQDRRKDWGE